MCSQNKNKQYDCIKVEILQTFKCIFQIFVSEIQFSDLTTGISAFEQNVRKIVVILQLLKVPTR